MTLNWPAPRHTFYNMQDERRTSHPVEIIPPDRGGSGLGGGQSFGAAPPQPLSPFLRTMIMVAVVAAALGLVALLLVFAATVVLIAVPAALFAGGVAWIGMRWRAWRGRG